MVSVVLSCILANLPAWGMVLSSNVPFIISNLSLVDEYSYHVYNAISFGIHALPQ